MNKIVYIGAETVGLVVLENLLRAKKNIVAAFTADDSLRYKIADFISFDYLWDVPLWKIKDSNDRAFIDHIKELEPDLIIVVSWSQIIPKEILKIPRLGCVGIHYSLLPQRRGGAPLAWAIIEGCEESGLSLIYLDEGIDTGDIIDQIPFRIELSDTPADLLYKIRDIAPKLLMRNIDAIENGTANKIVQRNKITITYRQRKSKDSEITEEGWNLSIQDLYNFMRALMHPYPNAFFKLGDDKILTINKAKLDDDGRIKIEGIIE
jgi:methionyl-tRNA formyltransferase